MRVVCVGARDRVWEEARIWSSFGLRASKFCPPSSATRCVDEELGCEDRHETKHKEAHATPAQGQQSLTKKTGSQILRLLGSVAMPALSCQDSGNTGVGAMTSEDDGRKEIDVAASALDGADGGSTLAAAGATTVVVPLASVSTVSI